MVVKCQICKINNAVAKDYRRIYDEFYDQYLVCYHCFWLNNNWFQKLMSAKEGLGKKRLISKIIEDTWKLYIIK